MANRRKPCVEFPKVPRTVQEELVLDSHGRPVDMLLSAKLKDLQASAAVCGELVVFCMRVKVFNVVVTTIDRCPSTCAGALLEARSESRRSKRR